MTRDQQPMDADDFLARYSKVAGRFVSRTPPSVAPDPASPPAAASKRDESARGRRAISAGKAFEQWLAWTHKYYQQRQMAQIYKAEVPTQPAPHRLIADPRHFGMVRIFSSRAKPDYYGGVPYIVAGHAVSVPIQMEAKSNGERQRALRIRAKGQKEHGVKESQLEILVQDWVNFGILGVLVWLNGETRLIFTPDVLEVALRDWRLGKVDRLSAEDATTYPRRHVPGSGYIEHWLAPAMAWWDGRHQTGGLIRWELAQSPAERGEPADAWSQGLGKSAARPGNRKGSGDNAA